MYLYFASPFRKFTYGPDVYINCIETAKIANFYVPFKEESFIIRWELWAGCVGEVGVVRVGYVFI